MVLQLLDHGNQLVHLGIVGGPAGADAHAVVAVGQIGNVAQGKFFAELSKLRRRHNDKLLVGGGVGDEFEAAVQEGLLDFQRLLRALGADFGV